MKRKEVPTEMETETAPPLPHPPRNLPWQPMLPRQPPPWFRSHPPMFQSPLSQPRRKARYLRRPPQLCSLRLRSTPPPSVCHRISHVCRRMRSPPVPELTWCTYTPLQRRSPSAFPRLANSLFHPCTVSVSAYH